MNTSAGIKLTGNICGSDEAERREVHDTWEAAEK
jgi:hypothetical protein